MIARKAAIASDTSSKDFIYELALAALSYVVGPSALHDNLEFKSQDKLAWAKEVLDKALNHQ